MRVVLVLGANGGIGTAVVERCAGRGDAVVLVGRSRRALDALAERVGPDRSLVAVADVLDAGAVDAAFDAAVARFGRVDAVVHTAAVVAYGRFAEVPAPVWDRVVQVGVLGTGNVARAALRTFGSRPGGGVLVVVGSILGEVTTPWMSSYVTSKWAVHGLVRTLQQEARSLDGVRVALVVPGSVRTAIYDLAASYAGRDGRPPPPVTSPERVADGVLRTLDGRRSVTSVGIANPLMRLGFTVTPWLYDTLVTPLMRVAGLRPGRSLPHDGNVFVPSEDVVRPG